MRTLVLANVKDLDEVLARFSNVEYTQEFWELRAKRVKEERERYNTEERNAMLDTLKNKDKVFGPLDGD